MPARRRMLGALVGIARIFGLLLIVIGVLGLPAMRFFTGRLAGTFGVLSSVALALMGFAWLAGVGLFLRFFDQYMSRN
jgi:hypothetical protein